MTKMTPQQMVDTYFRLTDDLALFWHGPMSNWWAAPYTRLGIEFNCSEQDMMFCKAMLFGDGAKAQEILDCRGPWDGTQAGPDGFNKYPRRQKELGRQVSGFDEAIWHGCCVDLVTLMLIHKLRAHEYIREVARLVGRRRFVEASPYDVVWGIGLNMNDPRALDPGTWRGKNYLGLALDRAVAVVL